MGNNGSYKVTKEQLKPKTEEIQEELSKADTFMKLHGWSHEGSPAAINDIHTADLHITIAQSEEGDDIEVEQSHDTVKTDSVTAQIKVPKMNKHFDISHLNALHDDRKITAAFLGDMLSSHKQKLKKPETATIRRESRESMKTAPPIHSIVPQDVEEHHNQPIHKEINRKSNGRQKTIFRNVRTMDNKNLRVEDGARRHERIEFQNGQIYEGWIVNGQRNGTGIMQWPDGSIYTGNHKDNEAHGWGILQLINGDRYEGQWFQQKAHGFGTYTSKSGYMYVGEWFYDRRDGKGQETYPDGSAYEGQFFIGHRHGQGTLNFVNGDRYKGSFVDGLPSGIGEMYWATGETYYGEWQNGKFHGEGTMNWDGIKYTGQYKKGLKHGPGTIQKSDGSKFQGTWSKGVIQGQGLFQTSQGQTIELQFINGRPILNSKKFIT